MIVTIPVLLTLCVCIEDISSASFSKVYVQNGPEYPVEYVEYGVPSVSYSPQIAHLTSAPVGSVPYSPNYIPPCGTSCVYPEPLAPVAPNANIVQYSSPSLPVVVAPSRSEHLGYEYSYVVYNEPTGDQKSHREFSDGSIVRGGYTFLQPDGYIREVQYVADDLQGFNNVVKLYVPEIVDTKQHENHEKHETSEPAPCHEVKNEQLEHENHEEKEHGHETNHAAPSHESLTSHHEFHNEEKHEQHAAAPHDSTDQNNAHHEEANKAAESHENHESHNEHGHEAHHEISVERTVGPTQHELTHTEHHQSDSEIGHVEQKPSHEAQTDHNEGHLEVGHLEHEPSHEADSKHHEAHSKSVHVEQTSEAAGAEISKGESHVEVHHIAPHEQHTALVEPNIVNSNILIPYNDIIRCIQAALSGTHGGSVQNQESPLTYIILNKPC